MNRILQFIVDLFYPNRCPICKSFIEWDKLICTECRYSLEPFPEKICGRCGKAECYCSKIVYDKAFVCFYYEGLAKNGIFSLKNGHKEFGCYLGQLLGYKIKNSEFKADAVVPVPMSAESYRKRRYNQAEVIAREIAEINHIPILTDIIHKNKSAVQHSLNADGRIKNTKAFYHNTSKRLNDMKIILCDDVITTGSTINKCAELLKELGAAEICAAAGTTTKLKKE